MTNPNYRTVAGTEDEALTREELLRVRGPGFGQVPTPVRAPKQRSADMPPPGHGTRNRYKRHRCRCRWCTEANTAYFRERRNRGSAL